MPPAQLPRYHAHSSGASIFRRTLSRTFTFFCVPPGLSPDTHGLDGLGLRIDSDLGRAACSLQTQHMAASSSGARQEAACAGTRGTEQTSNPGTHQQKKAANTPQGKGPEKTSKRTPQHEHSKKKRARRPAKNQRTTTSTQHTKLQTLVVALVVVLLLVLV